MVDLQQANALETEARKNDGHCTRCEQTIKIYRYGISQSMLTALKAIAGASQRGGDIIEVDKLDLKINARMQVSKLRYHGLVAKVKENGQRKLGFWVVTTKGWEFIGGKDIPAKVVVYNNQVLGHEGGVTSIKRVGAELQIEQKPITEAESRTYADVRKPVYDKLVTAEYLGYSSGEFVKGQAYEIKMTRLQVGKPLNIQTPMGGEQEYKDVAAFARTWKVVA